jgi:hypothetical protein
MGKLNLFMGVLNFINTLFASVKPVAKLRIRTKKQLPC